MAGNKMSTKSKGKEDKSKGNAKSNEDSEEPDFALLRKPINTSVTGFGQARKIFDLATEELRDLLSNECDLLYECKVCRNLFRSLANFISHKRVYCKEKFNSSLHGHFIKASSTLEELMKIKNLEKEYTEALKEDNDKKESDEQDDRIPLTKDLTAIVEKLSKTKGVQENGPEEPNIALQKIPNSSVAVFQNVDFNEGKPKDKMKTQVKELDNILSKDIAVLQSDGSFKIRSSVPSESGSVIQISDDDDNDGVDNPKCKICDMQFSTQKTLKFHMKYKHLESRLVYPCPDCLEIFSTSWSVYRHLFKVHRKTAAQIRRLRESIQAKAFKMNNPPAFYERRKNNMKPAPIQKITEEERLDQENQAWMDNMECDGEVPRCGGCGRTFERRAALAAHTHTCQPRCRALARRDRPPEGRRIEIQIRKDYNKGPTGNINLPLKTTDTSELKIIKEEPASINKQNIHEQKADEVKDEEETPMDASDDDQKSNDTDSPEKPAEPTQPQLQNHKPIIRFPFAHQIEKSNLAAFRQKVEPDINIINLTCKKCDVRCNDIQELYDHMADHYKWMRYACKLCNYKNYNFEKLPEHVKVVHKLKGDKDFYFSTVKAIDGTEALIMSNCTEEANEITETSPESRRPSRCSSDSSRLSDDSSSSSTLVEVGSRKRKMGQNRTAIKKRKDYASKDGNENKNGDKSSNKNTILGENDSSCSVKTYEENSSDMDDIDEKITKRITIFKDTSSVASRRPVRRKAKPKNEDFEYDLSNLLKMEAQGYRDSQTTTTKSYPSKRKSQPEPPTNYETFNKDCCGALFTLSKKSVELSAALMKTNFSTYTRENQQQNVFVRPLLPKSLSKSSDKISPKKDNFEDKKETSSHNEAALRSYKISNEERLKKSEQLMKKSEELMKKAFGKIVKVSSKSEESVKQKQGLIKECEEPKQNEGLNPQATEQTKIADEAINKSIGSTNIDDDPTKSSEESLINNEENHISDSKKEPSCSSEAIKKQKFNIPTIMPFKFRRQSLELIKNPIINKNISDFTKVGMKTKILVIKPINRNKDGTKASNTPLKFQTIKLKDANQSSASSDKSSDQVVVVKVPQVECAIPRNNPDAGNSNNEKVPAAEKEIVNCKENDNGESSVEINGDTIGNCQNIETDIPPPPVIKSNGVQSNSNKEECINGEVETTTKITVKDPESISANAETVITEAKQD